MAKERIDLELGGRYSLGDAFKQMNTDLSKAQKSVKDFSKGGGDVLRELSGAFDGELGGAISKVSGMLNKIVQGGIFGAIGAAATAAVGMMVNHFKEAAEKAKHMAEVLQAEVVVGMTNVGVKVAELSKSMKDAEKDAEAGEVRHRPAQGGNLAEDGRRPDRKGEGAYQGSGRCRSSYHQTDFGCGPGGEWIQGGERGARPCRG